MTIIYNIILNIILLLFPILLYFVSIAHNRTINKDDNNLLLEISLFSSLYLLIRLGQGNIIYLLNIPLLVAYYRNRKGVYTSISIFLILFLFYSYNFNIILIIIDYLLCFIVYKVFNKKINIPLFIIIQFIFIMIYSNTNILINIYNVFVFIIILVLVLVIINYVDNIMNYYMTIKDLEHEKQFRTSLFKISHEIKNPLAVCKGYLNLMDGSKEKYEKYVPIINEEIDHALLILQDFSSIGKLKIALDVLDINALLVDVINDLKPLLDSNNIVIDYQLEDEVMINGDYLRLKQVFVNMIKNSIEALDNVSNKHITIKENITKDIVTIKIIDNGCGIDCDNLSKIGTPFFTTKSKGTGLGSYLSKEIIESHKGSLKYSSSNGTTVTITLNTIDI